jgi:hypothetical protein
MNMYSKPLITRIELRPLADCGACGNQCQDLYFTSGAGVSYAVCQTDNPNPPYETCCKAIDVS